MTEPLHVTAGQVWSSNASLVSLDIRIVCRYPFHTYDSPSPVWIVESLNRINLERLPEDTLRMYYQLKQDVPTH